MSPRRRRYPMYVGILSLAMCSCATPLGRAPLIGAWSRIPVYEKNAPPPDGYLVIGQVEGKSCTSQYEALAAAQDAVITLSGNALIVDEVPNLAEELLACPLSCGIYRHVVKGRAVRLDGRVPF